MKSNEIFADVTMMKTNKPWRVENGDLRGNDELKEMATQWTASTWEAFLADTEMGENVESSPEDEVLFPYPSRDDIFSTENSLKDFISNLKIQYFPKLAKAFQKAISALSEGQYKIIYLTFWKGLNQTQIAAELGINQSRVSRQLVKSLSKMRTEILKELCGDNEQSAETPQNAGKSYAKEAIQINSGT